MFSRIVTDYWLTTDASDVSDIVGEHRIVIDNTLPENRPLMLLEPVGRSGTLSLTSALAGRIGLTGQATVSAERLTLALGLAGMNLHGADYLFYLPTVEQALVRSEQTSTETRQLTADDAHTFAQLTAEAPEADLDEAFVELDHWLVFGTFADGRLVSAASMYPWRNSQMADIGVVTLPAFRGQRLAKATVRAMSARALEQGYEPQYRCQLDNAPSIALAGSAGFVPYGTWDAIDLGGD